jgi:HAD superfamily hydrolase (TIGR01490 family)
MTAEHVPVVFADVDETIIRGKSLIQFARHVATFAPAEEVDELHEFVQGLIARMRKGAPREELNAAYYSKILRRRALPDVRSAADAWYAEETKASGFLKRAVLDFLRAAREAGSKIVLVSGSFRELLAPIADIVGASHVLGAPLEEHSGFYTGRLLGPPVIGEGKAKAVMAFAAAARVDLDECAAVADDLSDVPFLQLTGKRYVPADAEAEMIRMARASRWGILQDE